jgi:hypothetical protein
MTGRQMVGGVANVPSELGGLWQPRMVLKRDLFSAIERGEFLLPAGRIDAVLRRIDGVSWWAWPIAWHLLRREARALRTAGQLGVAPPLLYASRRYLVRGFLHGVAMHVAKPVGDAGYFRAAKTALYTLHRAGVCHNDLAKEQNWLRGPQGEAYMTDFQLAAHFRRGSWLHRIAAYEDLRHLLKHKRRYAPETLTAMERRVVERKSIIASIWMASGKRVYLRITRGLRIEDREGGGIRTSRDMPSILAQIRQYPGVRDIAIIPLPGPAGMWLYAFVEASGVEESTLHEHIGRSLGPDAAPEFIQVAEALPRNAGGAIRTDLLALIPYNQIDDLDRLPLDLTDRRIVASLLANRKEYGFGPRHSRDAPALAASLKSHPGVRDAVVLSFPHQRLFTGLYAFVEADDVPEAELRNFLNTDAAGRRPPDFIQVVAALPRGSRGELRADLLKDIVMNELDRIGAWNGPERERKILADILANRKILRDL